MKDIIAALEAKREAARRGGGEKRHAAQHASSGVAMRVKAGVFLAGAMLSIGVLLGVPPSAAQQNSNETWRSPTRAWSLAIDTSQWRYGSPPPGVSGDTVFGAFPPIAPPVGETRICQARENISPPRAGLDDAGIRQYASRIDLARATAVFGANGETVTDVAHSTVSDIAVAEISTAGTGGFSRFRVFAIPTSNGFAMVQLSCSWSADISAEGRGAVDSLLTSLSFSGESQ